MIFVLLLMVVVSSHGIIVIVFLGLSIFLFIMKIIGVGVIPTHLSILASIVLVLHKITPNCDYLSATTIIIVPNCLVNIPLPKSLVYIYFPEHLVVSLITIYLFLLLIKLLLLYLFFEHLPQLLPPLIFLTLKFWIVDLIYGLCSTLEFLVIFNYVRCSVWRLNLAGWLAAYFRCDLVITVSFFFHIS